jgi:hypothetical protein
MESGKAGERSDEGATGKCWPHLGCYKKESICTDGVYIEGLWYGGGCCVSMYAIGRDATCVSYSMYIHN